MRPAGLNYFIKWGTNNSRLLLHLFLLKYFFYIVTAKYVVM